MTSIADSPVTITLIFANAAISMWAFYSNPIYYEKLAERPYEIVYEKKFYQMFTSAFLHADYFHLFFNMYALYIFGTILEPFWNEEFGFATGSLIFAAVYFISLLFSSLLTVLLHYKDRNYAAVGASGAVEGIVFAFVVYAPFSTLAFFFIPMPAWLFALLYLGFTIYGVRTRLGNIGHAAHLGGAIAGFFFTLFCIPGAMDYFLSNF
ncbi:MAG TPA: rhomboid family intramembrane serine protease [Ignavibacteria bacterium]|nr:rhomboid family intramembrane serine protease [Ignavibacteria bacterium]